MPRKTRAQAFAAGDIALSVPSAISRTAMAAHDEYRPGFYGLQNLLGRGSGGVTVV
ncbi:MAG TPA: hypothetical protein VN728_02210 [Stellaceae bacterium]|nr:hypothetical protein [Stellaceae bacterium]